jgi:hypothetical protein
VHDGAPAGHGRLDRAVGVAWTRAAPPGITQLGGAGPGPGWLGIVTCVVGVTVRGPPTAGGIPITV